MIFIQSAAFALAAATSLAGIGKPAPQPFSVTGRFVEGCSCSSPCPCQLSGIMDGCEGVGVLDVQSGTYAGMDMSGAKIMYASAPGKWVTLYIDAPSPEKRKAAEAFARAYYAAFGPIQGVKAAKISMTGQEGKYAVRVTGGCQMSIETAPIKGGDGKGAMSITNIHDPVHPTIWMGKTVKCAFRDGSRTFKLSDSNSYFVPSLTGKGKL